MRPHVCIPSGCQQWTSRTLAVGIDKFAYMSSLAVYVYSAYTFQPIAILARHEQHLSALAMSPFDSNLLACIIGNQELRVYDVDSELPLCKTKYTGTKAKASILEWHRTQPGVLLMAIGGHLIAWDFGEVLEAVGAARAGAAGASNGTGATGVAAPPSAPPPSVTPRSVLMRLRGHARGGSGSGGSGAAGDASDLAATPSGGRWVVLRDFGSHVTALDQCVPTSAGPGSGAGGIGATAPTVLAVATADCRVVLMELELSGLAVRCELRSIALPDAGAGSVSSAGLPVGSGSAVAFEPLSGNGLLLAVGRGGAMSLYDTANGEAVLTYSKQPATATRFAQFVPSQPGNFLVSSSRSGALQLWNVSQPLPLRLFKLGGGLVQGFALLPLPALPPHHPQNGGAGSGHRTRRTAVLVSFADGALCVYDLGAQQVLWRQEGGHTETVFDCRFSATDPNLLATASFDSTVRVWDVRTARCVRQLMGGEGILYSVSWSADGKMLAASNDSGWIYLYDYGRGMLVKSLRQHTKQSLRVAFHPQKPNLLASASIDGSVFVYTTDGELQRTLRHVSAVSCIAWGPAHLAPNLLATTCEEGELHVWDISRPAHDCLVRTLSKHSSRTFNVEFSPLLRNLLLSSSNDHTARVWDISTGQCMAVLQGHTAEVRAVAWHPEVAHICFTGSWDAAVRVWDIRNGRCIHVANDHVADVYGIACHPQRPFFMVTCSRDTTLRLWSTADLTPNLLPLALVRSLAQLRLPPDEALALNQGAPAVLSGEASRELGERLAAPACTPLERFAAIVELFLPPACVDVFWDLARSVRAAANASETTSSHANAAGGRDAGGLVGISSFRQRHDSSGAAAGGGDGGAGGGGGGSDDWYALHHWASARLALGSTANHLELAAYSKARGATAATATAASGPAGGSAAVSRRHELLRAAAQQHLVAGNVEHCCELLAELGDWDRALALAPVVGLGLWQRLMRQRAQALAETEAQSHVSDVLPLYLVSGQIPALVDMLSSAGMHDTAFNVAAVQAAGGYQNIHTAFSTGPGPGGSSVNAVQERGQGAHNGTSAGDAAVVSTTTTTGAVGAQAAVDISPERIRSSLTSDLPITGQGLSQSLSIPPGAGFSSLASALASPGASLSSSVSLPPVQLRGGTLPSLGRAPSLRPPPLSSISGNNAPGAALSPAPSAASAAAALLPSPSQLSSPPPNGRPESGGTSPCHAFSNGASGSVWEASASTPASQLPALSPSRSTPPPYGTLLHSRQPPPAPSPPSAAVLLPPPRPGGRDAGGATAPAAAPATGPADRAAFERAIAVRCAQARVYIAQGLPLPAACCALSVDDLPGAVGLLLRGGMEDAALALVSGLSRPVAAAAGVGGSTAAALLGFGLGIAASSSGGGGGGGYTGAGGFGAGGYGNLASLEAAAVALRPRVLAAAAQRREASGDFLTAAELMKQVPGRSDLRELLAGRCRARCDSPTIVSTVFSILGLKEPSAYAESSLPPPGRRPSELGDSGAGGGGPGGGPWQDVRKALLAGQQAAAAERAVAAVGRLVETGERVTLTSPEWEQAWMALNSLCAAPLPGTTWARVFALAAYLGALVALEQGAPTVGLYLVRVLEAWVAGRADVDLPVSAARLAAEVSEALDACLALPAFSGPGEVREALAELAAAPKGSAWLQGIIQSRLTAAEPHLSSPPALASPNSTASRVSGALSPTHGGPGGGTPESTLASPTSSLARRLASSTAAAAAAVAAVSGGGGGGASLRLGGQEFGSGPGRLMTGSALAASLSSSFTGGGGGGDATGGRASDSGGSGGVLTCLADLARGPVVVAAAHVPSRPSSSLTASGALATSAVTGGVIRGAAVVLDDGRTRVSLSEAVAVRRVMAYSPLGTGKLLGLP